MKKFTKIILATMMLMYLLVPIIAYAQGESRQCTSKLNLKGGDCLTDDDKKNYIYTILETPLDTPDTTSQPGGDQSVRSCIRYTEILKNCSVEDKVQDIVNVKLLLGGSDVNQGECDPNITYGTSEGGESYYDCKQVTVILSKISEGGIGFLNTYVGLIYRWVAGIVGILSVLIIIISSLQITTAQGEPSTIEEARKRITQVIGGIILFFLGSGLLYMINPTFFKPPTYPEATQNATPVIAPAAVAAPAAAPAPVPTPAAPASVPAPPLTNPR